MLCNCCMALCGTRMAFLRSATCTRTRPNCPGSTVRRELGKRACNSRVAVLGSTWFSEFSMWPTAGGLGWVGGEKGGGKLGVGVGGARGVRGCGGGGGGGEWGGGEKKGGGGGGGRGHPNSPAVGH